MNGADLTDITVAVCTFRRALLADTLRSLAVPGQFGGARGRVLVADNDEHPVRQAEIEQLGRDLGLDLTYLHAPARNISVARNACLDHCQTRWLAFIDDDEQAEPEWLAQLATGRDAAEITFGTVRALYPAAAPAWAVTGDFHATRLAGRDAPWNGYSGNVLIAMPFVRQHGLRFDPALGLTGGEDTLFFLSARLAGARFGYRAAAVVNEPVDPRRLKLGWLLRRRFRSGQIHWLVLGRTGGRAGGGIAAACKLLACLALALVGLGNAPRWRAGLLRAALHAGVLASALGFPLYREYARPVQA